MSRPKDRQASVGSLCRRLVLRERQQRWLRLLVDCGGSRRVAIESSEFPRGTILRWLGSDPWLRGRYEQIRGALTRDEQILRANLEAASVAMALGEYRGLLKVRAVRQILDGLDRREADSASSAQLDAEILALLGE
jgi:hypothetical protein